MKIEYIIGVTFANDRHDGAVGVPALRWYRATPMVNLALEAVA